MEEVGAQAVGEVKADKFGGREAEDFGGTEPNVKEFEGRITLKEEEWQDVLLLEKRNIIEDRLRLPWNP